MASPIPNHEKFVSLYVRHQMAIHSFVLTLVPNMASAEDVVQQASMTMWRKFDQYEPGSNFRSWAFKIAQYTAYNHLKKTRRDKLVFSEELMEILAEDTAGRAEELEARREALTECVGKLPKDDHAAVVGCYLEGSSIKNFAEENGLSPNSVYKRLNRVRSNLMRCIQAEVAGAV